MKRLIYCLDGTSNTYDAAYPTNVVIAHKSVAETDDRGTPQISYYDRGVGTESGERFRGLAFGFGLMENVLQAYEHLCRHYEDGDEIFVFGFSRGAYTARSFAGLIRLCGLLDEIDQEGLAAAKTFYERRLLNDPEHEYALAAWRARRCSRVCVDQDDDLWRAENLEAYKRGQAPIIRIRYLGVWDTVKTLGVDGDAYEWHDARLSEHVDFARHAVAIDERRIKFRVELWDNIETLNAGADTDGRYQQKWFPGGHGSVGGGGPERGLSDAALHWVLKGAEEAGLALKTDPASQVFTIRPNALAPLENASHPFWRLGKTFTGWLTRLAGLRDRAGPAKIGELSHAALVRYHAPDSVLPERRPYRPGALRSLQDALSNVKSPSDEAQYRLLAGEAGSREAETAGPQVIRSGGRDYLVHIVEKGDTLFEIARVYSGDPRLYPDLYEINDASIDDPDVIYVGQRILVPADWRDLKAARVGAP